MKKLPKISIIIPSFNKVDFIEETLKSIIFQKYPNLEVIIQDGGSTDGTLDIIKRYAKKYPKIINYVSKKDKGQLDAINKGLKKAKGEIITYINADDVYEKGALKKVGEIFRKHPETLWLAGKGKVINEEGEEIAKLVTWYKNLLLRLNKYTLLLIVNYLMQPSVFLSRKAVKKYGPFAGTRKFVMEYDLWLRLGEIEMPKVINQTLSCFRLEEKSISSTQYIELLDSDVRILRKYSKNKLVLFLHKLNNLGRIAILKY